MKKQPNLEVQETAKAENKIQQEIVMWYRNTYCLRHNSPRCMIFSVPNEGRGAASMRLIQTGLYPGCSDLVILREDRTYFFEVKTPEGVQSDSQKEFQAHAEQMGIPYRIVRSLDDFKQVVRNL